MDNKVKVINRDTYLDFDSHIVYELPKATKSILDYKVLPQISINFDYPKFSLGFQHFVHANKDKLDLTKKFEGKKPVYNVVNNYNTTIDNSDQGIKQLVRKYIDDKPDIIDDNFYKLWEILMVFDVAKLNSSINVTNLNPNKGGFVQALLLFRKLLTKKTTKFHIINGEIDQKFKKYYHKRLSENFSKSDLMIVSCFGKWKYRNLIEQESFNMLIKQLKQVSMYLNDGGNIICHIYENYTITLNKIIYMLTEVYEKVYIIKPFTSPCASSEKFIVCINYDIKKKNKMTLALSEMMNLKDKKIVDIFKKFELPDSYTSIIRKANTDLSNRQLIDVNRIAEFINGDNFYGDVYNKYRDEQIKKSKSWGDKFLPDKKLINEKRKELFKVREELTTINKQRALNLSKKLI